MSDWKSSMGLSEDTALVKLYPPESHKATWQTEAEKRDVSMSRYLQELIQEARYPREQGQLKLGDRRKVEQLEEEIEELERQLENRSSTQVTSQSRVEPEFAREVLSDNYTPLDQLLNQLLQHPEFKKQIRLDLETCLYQLGDQAQVVFRRGKGWKHNSGGEK